MLPLLLAAAVAGQPTARPLTVTPAAEPRPALRYELLPPLRDRQPGNAALAYFRAFAARPRPANKAAAEAREKALEKWRTTPMDQLPKDEVRKFLDESARMFRELDRAVVADSCDWGMLPRLKTEGIEAIADVQQSREVMALLNLGVRLELAEGRFDDAAKSLRAGFQMAKHVGESPTQLQLLVGLALEAITLERVEDWIARPDSPNLYWALTNLPRPVIDPWPGFQGEQAFHDAKLPTLAKLRAGPIPKERSSEILDGVSADLMGLGSTPDNPAPAFDALERTANRVGMTAYVGWKFPAARKTLLALGRTDSELDAMAPAQVVYLATLEQFLALRDDYWKWVGVPYHRAWPELKKLNARVAAERAANGTDPFFVVLAMTLPATEKVMWAAARTDRRVQMLRAVEAVRLHAAAHGGTPPAALADITAVPVPDDPITGKPFGYEVKGNVVVLTGGPPAGEKAGEGNAVRYELTFRGAKP
jgi:hypothetical protein